MARGFQIKKDLGEGKFVEREYELSGDTITLLTNRKIKIPVRETDDPVTLVEAYERKMQPTLTGAMEITEFESYAGTYLPSIARPLKSYTGELLNPVAENEIAKSYRRENNSMVTDIESVFVRAIPSSPSRLV